MLGLFGKDKAPKTMVEAVSEFERQLTAAVVQARLKGVYSRVMVDALEQHAKALKVSAACQ
jgi:hypothetical protein